MISNKYPQLSITALNKLESYNSSDEEALIVITDDMEDIDSIRDISDTILVLQFCEDDAEAVDNKDELRCSLDEIKALITFCLCNDDYKRIYITDNSNLRRAFSVMLIMNHIYTQNIVDALYKTVKECRHIPPVNIWPVELYDLLEDLGGELVRVTDEYLASGIVVDTKGNILEGSWSISE